LRRSLELRLEALTCWPTTSEALELLEGLPGCSTVCSPLGGAVVVPAGGTGCASTGVATRKHSTALRAPHSVLDHESSRGCLALRSRDRDAASCAVDAGNPARWITLLTHDERAPRAADGEAARAFLVVMWKRMETPRLPIRLRVQLVIAGLGLRTRRADR
jgi:hypothetical protein